MDGGAWELNPSVFRIRSLIHILCVQHLGQLSLCNAHTHTHTMICIYSLQFIKHFYLYSISHLSSSVKNKGESGGYPWVLILFSSCGTSEKPHPIVTQRAGLSPFCNPRALASFDLWLSTLTSHPSPQTLTDRAVRKPSALAKCHHPQPRAEEA